MQKCPYRLIRSLYFSFWAVSICDDDDGDADDDGKVPSRDIWFRKNNTTKHMSLCWSLLAVCRTQVEIEYSLRTLSSSSSAPQTTHTASRLGAWGPNDCNDSLIIICMEKTTSKKWLRSSRRSSLLWGPNGMRRLGRRKATNFEWRNRFCLNVSGETMTIKRKHMGSLSWVRWKMSARNGRSPARWDGVATNKLY